MAQKVLLLAAMKRLSLGTLLLVAASSGCTSIEFPPHGSYSLTFHDIEVPQEGESPAAAEGVTVRVDVHEDGDGYQYLSAVPFGWIDSDLAALEDDVLTLESLRTGQEEWSRIEIELDLDDDDGIIGEGTAVGVQRILKPYMDNGYSFPVEGSVTLAADDVVPEVRFYPEDDSTAVLPWTHFRAWLSEPIPGEQVAAHLQAQSQSGEPLEVTVTPTSAVGGGTVPTAVTWATVDLPWTTLADGESLTLTSLAGLADPNGNSSVEHQSTFELIALGAPQGAYTFENEIGGHAWGDVSLASCDGVGCLSLGTFEIYSCDDQVDRGMAGRLSSPGATSVVVRYRVTSPSSEWSDNALGLEVATENETETTRSTQPEADQLVEQDGLWVSDWLELTAEVGAFDVLGFAVSADASGGCNPHGGPGPYQVSVEIESIEAR
ncbi:MAG: hypothetical protein DRI90_18965 [Deltaproteobacteria bacterium]|nr:MAG: hypothetical protein DRI90_18965 [Deltaproteobacteria bacterium]